MLRSLFLAGVLLVASSLPTQAQTLVDGTSVDEIVNLARGYGAASSDTTADGQPMIVGKVSGVEYRVFFHDCTDTGCPTIRFYSLFAGNKPTLEMINEWNRDKRWGKAYVDADLDAVLEWDVNLAYGVARENLDDSISIWVQILDAYATFIGAK